MAVAVGGLGEGGELLGAGGEWWGLVDPPSSSLRRREGLAVASTGCWDGLTGTESCAQFIPCGQEV